MIKVLTPIYTTNRIFVGICELSIVRHQDKNRKEAGRASKLVSGKHRLSCLVAFNGKAAKFVMYSGSFCSNHGITVPVSCVLLWSFMFCSSNKSSCSDDVLCSGWALCLYYQTMCYSYVCARDTIHQHQGLRLPKQRHGWAPWHVWCRRIVCFIVCVCVCL